MYFEDIRSYNDGEYDSTIKKLLKEEIFVSAVQFYFPELSFREIEQQLLSFTSINAFQSNFICPLMDRVIDRSVSNLSFKGIHRLNKKEAYLFISNHRDIVLDSALLNVGLNKYGFNTSEIAIGSNLLSIPWVKDLVRLNKSFIVKRDVGIKESLQASQKLSSYLYYTLKEKKESIWIAQREGRAKDGFDQTNPGILKMFAMRAKENHLNTLLAMNIKPISISYEYDPCDSFKVNELITKSRGGAYVKSPKEDIQHMLAGIKGDKGNVNFTFEECINEKLESFSPIKNKNELFKNVAACIDHSIYKNYHLWNSNYVAYDLLNSSNKYIHQYDDDGKEKFLDYMNQKLMDYPNNPLAKELFLKMYANPVINKEYSSISLS